MGRIHCLDRRGEADHGHHPLRFTRMMIPWKGMAPIFSVPM